MGRHNCPALNPWAPLTLWGPYKMTTILQPMYSNAFFQWKLLYFDSNFSKICSHWLNYQNSSIALDDSLAIQWQQAIMWTNDGLVYWCTYASLSLQYLTNAFNLILARFLHLFTTQFELDGLWPVLVKIQSFEIECQNCCITLNFHRCFGSSAAETHVKVQNEWAFYTSRWTQYFTRSMGLLHQWPLLLTLLNFNPSMDK